jgi:hypothetical protein
MTFHAGMTMTVTIMMGVPPVHGKAAPRDRVALAALAARAKKKPGLAAGP